MTERKKREIKKDAEAGLISVSGVIMDVNKLPELERNKLLFVGIQAESSGVADLEQWWDDLVNGTSPETRERAAWIEAYANAFADAEVKRLKVRPAVGATHRDTDEFKALHAKFSEGAKAWTPAQLEKAQSYSAVRREFNTLTGVTEDLGELFVEPTAEVPALDQAAD